MLTRLKRRLPDATDEALLQDLLDDAGRFIRAYTGRESVPEALEGAQLALAAAMFNRMGMEGETRHGEGSVERVAELLPEDVRRQINPYRLAKAVGP
ncbi:MAG TPA: phage head-tail connector protein [Candidatus Pullichristensenella avicola]|nr:phage head-tail connector protein [Candidatus Pullichristensenella avicola]